MKMKAHQLVGLAKPVYLPDDIVVEIAIVPSTVRNVRSNQKRSAGQVTTYTQHETANFNAGANADMHKRWLHSGAGGAYVGFNFAVDDRKIIQLTPLDEITWAAGTPAGNLTSDHSELCVNSDINHAKARRNAAALAAGVLKARGLGIDKLVQHNHWTGKDCPYLMRRNNLWAGTFVPMVREFYSGSVPPAPEPTKPPTPQPSYPSAAPIAGTSTGRSPIVLDNKSVLLRAPLTVRAKKQTPRLRYASNESDRIGPDIDMGAEFAVSYLILNPDGSLFWYTPYATRVRHGDVDILGAI